MFIRAFMRTNWQYIELNNRFGSCYIATELYGGYDEPNVIVLRAFRDMRLKKSNIGRKVVKVYYSYSPYFSNRLHGKKKISIALKKIIDIFVFALQIDPRIRDIINRMR